MKTKKPAPLYGIHPVTEALKASQKVAARVPKDMHGDDWALYQTFLSMPLYTMARFGMWDEILKEEKPAPRGAQAGGDRRNDR